MTLDLSLLKPLWTLYNVMTKDEPDNNTVLPPAVRALSELFFQVESLAMVRNEQCKTQNICPILICPLVEKLCFSRYLISNIDHTFHMRK